MAEAVLQAALTENAALEKDNKQLRKDIARLKDNMAKQRENGQKQLHYLHEEKQELKTELARIHRKLVDLDLADVLEIEDTREISPALTEMSTAEAGMRSEGDSLYPQEVARTVDGVHEKKNILVVRFGKSDPTVVASGGVDHCVRIMSWRTGVQLAALKLSAPVLALDWCPIRHKGEDGCCLLAAGCMDGSVHALVWRAGSKSKPAVSEGKLLYCMCAFTTCHEKYVVGVRWSPQGTYLATASYDHTVTLFSVVAARDTTIAPCTWDDQFRLLKRYFLKAAVEGVAFVPPLPKDGILAISGAGASSSGTAAASSAAVGEATRLVIAERSTVFLRYVDLPSLKTSAININEKDDMHLSFSIVGLEPSPNGQLLCLATDADQHVVLRTGTSERVAVLFGHTCGEYGQPSLTWGPSGEYIFSSSQEDACVYVWSCASQRMVKRLCGHSKQVRSVHMHPTERVLVSGSFDKSVVFWKSPSSE